MGLNISCWEDSAQAAALVVPGRNWSSETQIFVTQDSLLVWQASNLQLVALMEIISRCRFYAVSHFSSHILCQTVLVFIISLHQKLVHIKIRPFKAVANCLAGFWTHLYHVATETNVFCKVQVPSSTWKSRKVPENLTN